MNKQFGKRRKRIPNLFAATELQKKVLNLVWMWAGCLGFYVIAILSPAKKQTQSGKLLDNTHQHNLKTIGMISYNDKIDFGKFVSSLVPKFLPEMQNTKSISTIVGNDYS